ncbi:MAG: hypothetical protein ACRD2O_09820 [Terriglobia bacterium]
MVKKGSPMLTVRRTAWVLVALWIFCEPGSGDRAPGATRGLPPPSDLKLLVKNTFWNELQARKHPSAYFEYRQVDWSPESSTTSRKIETPQGTVSSVLTENGEPLTGEQRQKNGRQLQRLVHSKKLQRQHLASQQQEIQRRMGLFRDFPSAFLFQMDGVENNGVVRLKFWPNPKFQPLSKEGLALRGMAGTLWINPQSQRLVKIKGALIRDVSLGWGMVVRLHRGGHFMMQQADVGKGNWKTTLLAVDLTGKILLVKKLRVHMKQTREAFQEVESDLTVVQAVDMLRSDPPR